VFFSDAVFAIAITLLVLPLADSHITDENVGRQILDLAPKMFSFALSFLIIGLLWIGHNRGFSLIARVDRKLMFLNLPFLTSHDRRLIRQDVQAIAIRHLRLRSYIVPVCYVPSIPVAFESIVAAKILWLMSFVLGFVLNRFVPPAD
jgi:Endosomal/lysosomal potassium channel TMEM175